MSLSSWRQFQFFEAIPIRDPFSGSSDDALGQHRMYSDPTLTAIAPLRRNELVLAVSHTNIRVVDLSKPAITHEFTAFDGGFRVTYLEVIGNQYLIAVAEQTGIPSLLKLYDLNAANPKSPHQYHAMVEIKNGDNTFPITKLSVASDVSCIAVGFINGRVIVIRGDIKHDRGSRQRVIYDDPNKEPITALSLNKDATKCFIGTTSKLYVFTTAGNNSGKPDLILNDHEGVDLHCSSFNNKSGEFICFLNQGLQFYKDNGESHRIAFETLPPKRTHSINDRYILLVTETEKENNSPLAFVDTNLTRVNTNRVLILDTINKIIAFNWFISDSIMSIYLRNANKSTVVSLLSTAGTVYNLMEKDYQDQVDITIQRQLFPFALQLCEQYSMPKSKSQHIHRQFGDYLFNKGMTAEATEQYIMCMDAVESSEIISKLGIEGTRNPSSVRNLANYLLSLIKRADSNSEHVTLFLICLIKLKDTNAIEDFIAHFGRDGLYHTSSTYEDIDDETFLYSDTTLLDIELILGLLEETGFHAEAYQLCMKFSKDPSMMVHTLLEILDRPQHALDYLKSLSIDDILRILIKYSKTLLDKIPNETNLLLIEVFTGKFKRTTAPNAEFSDINDSRKQPDGELSRVFYSYNTFFSYMNKKMGMIKDAQPTDTELAQKQQPTYLPPKPSLLFASFISHPFEFVVFLEACLESYHRYEGFDEDKQVILTTLYDLYLSLAESDVSDRTNDWRNRAKKVLQESRSLVVSVDAMSTTSNTSHHIDNSLMMLTSHMYNISLDDYEDDQPKVIKNRQPPSNSNFDIYQTFISLTLTGKAQECLKFYKKYNESEPKLHRAALPYFTSSSQVLAAIGGEETLKEEVVKAAVESEALTIIDIIQLLSKTNVATYGMIKEFLTTQMQLEDADITKNASLIKLYQSELDEKKAKLNSLFHATEPTQLNIKNHQCFMCNTSLDLPIAYFKCGHLYHERCLNKEMSLNGSKTTFKCPKCIASQESAEKLKQAQNETASKLNLLELALNDEDNKDRFKTITEFIGRGGLEYSQLNVS